jgi:hypothetical protein
MRCLCKKTADYLASMSKEMAQLAEEANLPTLVHVFRMAELEAKNNDVRRTNSKQGLGFKRLNRQH